MTLQEALSILETRQKWLLRRMKQEGLTTPTYVRAEEGALRTVLGRVGQLPVVQDLIKLADNWRRSGFPSLEAEDAATELELALKKWGVVLPERRKAV